MTYFEFNLLNKALEQSEALWDQNCRMSSVITAATLVTAAFRMNDENALVECLRMLTQCVDRFNEDNNQETGSAGLTATTVDNLGVNHDQA